jgi:outer membrane biosynthesis protein TonB
VTVLSYRDNVDFGFLAAAELVPDVWDLADHIEEAMAELLAAAAAETAGRDEPSPEAAQANGAARRPKADETPPKAPAAPAAPAAPPAKTAKPAKAAKAKPVKKPKGGAPAPKAKAKAAKAPATGPTRSPRR